MVRSGWLGPVSFSDTFDVESIGELLPKAAIMPVGVVAVEILKIEVYKLLQNVAGGELCHESTKVVLAIALWRSSPAGFPFQE